MTVRRAAVADWFTRHRGRVVAFWLLAVLALAGAAVGRQLGEGDRTKAAVAANTAGLRETVTRLERTIETQQKEILADCSFKWDLADIPRGIHPRAVGLVKIATDAREAYIEKRCERVGPPPPPVYRADPPAPTPTR